MTIPRNKREEAEAWWPLIARVVAFFFGIFLVYREQLPPPGVEEWIIMAAIGCMGPTVAPTVAMLIEAIKGTPNQGDPPM